jgi:hypothetical protein
MNYTLALLSKPRIHLTRFHGVFAHNSQHPRQLTPARRGKDNKAKASDEPQARTPHGHEEIGHCFFEIK